MKGRDDIFSSHCGPATVVVSSTVTVLIALNNHHTFSDMEIDFFPWKSKICVARKCHIQIRPQSAFEACRLSCGLLTLANRVTHLLNDGATVALGRSPECREEVLGKGHSIGRKDHPVDLFLKELRHFITEQIASGCVYPRRWSKETKAPLFSLWIRDPETRFES